MDLIKLVLQNEMCVGDLVKKLNLPQPKVSMMLKELRDLKLVSVVELGKRRFYSINREILNNYLIDIKKMLSDFETNSLNEIIVRRKVSLSN
ncbi:hypothetical protein CO009_01240 [Candidatus Shapirobacteria bacterium CG_4_8_14_3_um_filter_35_11]|uniref:HTH arsR-type domain-containing protein n=6 Tax=Candidatus Shapironibacteriota TaxID=1752721 RepID=A0A1J5HRP8_9BACT|nr:MAG: hypothetical protein AUK05_00475 [Candidatus Shapirobacteria bacterium CG2_30_35_20]PIV07153.1 MAG: hypothetical protein COS53_03060 [Candidatus Shapirobacteria bacterium CG03_land_8_20_14_0_80_35_14]PIX68368.1 MAG: hypothetical protein COZ41_00065 [Candidatus Shapirobacteria bacterium CG_4_10_14_3_um_filter_35_13]PJC80729.1 MAG: hypothetical protein CO009_01240 [Candidatus Shapirobacteria bacterium CG_4_8_14_3_um_filter_35_11]